MMGEALNIAVAAVVATLLLITFAKHRRQAREVPGLAKGVLLLVGAGLPVIYLMALAFEGALVREVQAFFHGLLAGVAAAFAFGNLRGATKTETGSVE